MATLFLLAIGLAIGGCRGRRAVRGVATGSGETPRGTLSVGGGEVASGTPREQLEQLDRLLRQQGYQPVGPATHANLQTNAMTAYAVDVRRGHCYTLAIFGAPGSDPNLVVLDPAGRDIAHNVRSDEHPWVGFCAARSGRFVARVHMASGAGEYFFAPYYAQGRRPADLTAFFGGAADDPAMAEIDAQTSERLAQLDRRMSAEGFRRTGEPQGLILRNNEERLFALSLEDGRCYAFATLGGPGATNTDVFLQDGTGSRLLSDTAEGPDSLVQYCAPQDGNYTLQIRLEDGEGPVFTAAYAQGNVSTSEPVIAAGSTAAGGLDENFALLDADMRARGYETFGAPQRGRLDPDGEQAFAVELEGGKCYAILAVGDSGVRQLSLALRDRAGRDVDRDELSDARPTVRVCPQTTGSYTMVVRMAGGAGNYVYAPYRWPRGTRLGDLSGVLYVRLAEITALLGVESFQPDPGYSLERGTLRSEGATASHELQLEGRQCYSVVVVGGEGVRDLDVALVQGGRQVSTDLGVRNAFPNVRHCVEQSGRFSLQVRAAVGSGDYVYQVFSQQGG